MVEDKFNISKAHPYNKNLMPEVGFEPTRTIAQQILSLPP